MGNMWKESTKRGGVNDAGEEVDEEEETRRGFLTVDVDKMEGEAADNLDLSLEMEVYGVKEIEGGGEVTMVALGATWLLMQEAEPVG